MAGRSLGMPGKGMMLMMPMGFPGGSDGKESVCNSGWGGVRSLGQEDPLEKGVATHSSILCVCVILFVFKNLSFD